jgi:hypothetical protein
MGIGWGSWTEPVTEEHVGSISEVSWFQVEAELSRAGGNERSEPNQKPWYHIIAIEWNSSSATMMSKPQEDM